MAAYFEDFHQITPQIFPLMLCSEFIRRQGQNQEENSHNQSLLKWAIWQRQPRNNLLATELTRLFEITPLADKKGLVLTAGFVYIIGFSELIVHCSVFVVR
jgi:hypothetical protein